MKPVFDYKEFIDSDGFPLSTIEVVTYANAKIQKLIDKSVTVYGALERPKDEYHWSPHQIAQDTHTAKLLFIEPIKKECVKHEPIEYNKDLFPKKSVCIHCGVELVAEWTERK